MSEYRRCTECSKAKLDKFFYKTRGNVCIGCCMVANYNASHKPEDPSQTREFLTEKYENKISQLERSLIAYQRKLEQIL